MAALLLNIQPGDEIIMPSYTFVSTANAFVLRGGVPVFVDIREDTLNRVLSATVQTDIFYDELTGPTGSALWMGGLFNSAADQRHWPDSSMASMRMGFASAARRSAELWSGSRMDLSRTTGRYG